MAMKGHKPGGGIASRNVRNVTAPKAEPKPHAKNPGRVAQYGQMVGNLITHSGSTNYRGEPDWARKQGYAPPQGPTSFSNVGPGAGRTIYKTGQQQQYGSGGAEKPAGRDILSSFGPDSRK